MTQKKYMEKSLRSYSNNIFSNVILIIISRQIPFEWMLFGKIVIYGKNGFWMHINLALKLLFFLLTKFTSDKMVSLSPH